MGEPYLPTIQEVAAAAGVSHWTVRRYIENEVIAAYKDRRGRVRCEPEAAEKVREQFLTHGGPGGRPMTV